MSRSGGGSFVDLREALTRGERGEARMRVAGCDGDVSKPIDVARFADQVLAVLAERPSAPA